MSQHSAPKKQRTFTEAQAVNSDSILLVRLVAAVFIFAVTLIVDMNPIISFLLRFIAAVIAAYDLALKAADELINKRNYFNEYSITMCVAVFAFAVGYTWDGTALVIIYRIGKVIVDYVLKLSAKTASSLYADKDENVVNKMDSLLEERDSTYTALADTVEHSAGFVLKIAVGLALLLAIFLPILTNCTYPDSIHRALIIIILATPTSVVAAMPVITKYAMSYAAEQGIIFKNARVIEKCADIRTVVLDKVGIFSEEAPKIMSAKSDLLSLDTFMTFAAHAVYYSEQPIAAAVSAKFDGEYKLEVVSDFKDLPGTGVELDIGGQHVIFALGEYFDSLGIEIPQSESDSGMTYYMTIGEHFAGQMELYSEYNEDCSYISPRFKEAGIEKTVLLTEDGKNESEDAADILGFDAFYSQCSPSKKRDIIEDIAARSRSSVMYIYSSGIESHSDASVDIRVARKGKYADALVLPENIDDLPQIIVLSTRARELATETAIFAFVIKALVIFLAINGWSTLWFAMFMDYAAMVASMPVASRLGSENLIKNLIERFRRQ